MTTPSSHELHTWSKKDLSDYYFQITGDSLKPTSYSKSVWLDKIAKLEADNESGANTDDEISELEADVVDLVCPHCKAESDFDDFETFPKAGDEGTILGACRTCVDCGTTFNELTGVITPLPKTKKKRVILNPQSKINAKTTHLKKEVNADLVYDRNERVWFIRKGGKDLATFDSKQLSRLGKDSLVALAKNGSKKTKK